MGIPTPPTLSETYAYIQNMQPKQINELHYITVVRRASNRNDYQESYIYLLICNWASIRWQ
jgi:hypothetical protein